jgi:long-subunit acyl-CoA synthetase (AMP-forming)
VPRVFEKIAEKMQAMGAKNTGLKKAIADWAKKTSLEYEIGCQLGGSGTHLRLWRARCGAREDQRLAAQAPCRTGM